jgi:hypothetical protein
MAPFWRENQLTFKPKKEKKTKQNKNSAKKEELMI